MLNVEELKIKYPLVCGAGNPVLREMTLPVKKFDRDIKEFAHALIELMRAYEGVGIAAPQVGQLVRMAAITQRDTSKKERELLTEQVIINPKLLYASDETEISEEGCLSLPGIGGKVERAKNITVEYYTPKGKKRLLKASGYNARIILHEMDHLDGVLFIDKTI